MRASSASVHFDYQGIDEFRAGAGLWKKKQPSLTRVERDLEAGHVGRIVADGFLPAIRRVNLYDLRTFSRELHCRP